MGGKKGFQKGHKRFNKTIFKKGEENIGWLGDKVSYRGIHLWINKRLGKPKKCEMCKKDNLTGQKIHWCNISHLYKREKKDWIRLCAKCHGRYDTFNKFRLRKKNEQK